MDLPPHHLAIEAIQPTGSTQEWSREGWSFRLGPKASLIHMTPALTTSNDHHPMACIHGDHLHPSTCLYRQRFTATEPMHV